MSNIFLVQISVNAYRSSRKNWYANRKSSTPLQRVEALDSRDRAIILRRSFQIMEKKS